MKNRFPQQLELTQLAIGVVGLGYVGLPLALSFAKKFPVIGVDTDERKRAALRAGKSYLASVQDADISASKLAVVDTIDELMRIADVVIICVPTPLTRNREPDLSHVVAAAKSMSPRIRSGQLIVLESTTYPGTTRDVLLPALKHNTSVDFLAAFSSEREDPGNRKHPMHTIPKVIGGIDDVSCHAACRVYSAVFTTIIPVANPEIAEMSKLLENIFRSVNIALVNEMKMVCQAMGLDIWAVIKAASTKPFGFMPFHPGPGLGGHCIPIDPFYLTWKAREYGVATRFIELAGEINARMPFYVVKGLTDALNKHGKAVNKARILLVGLAYKANVEDMRESPAIKIAAELYDHGAYISYHDPFIESAMGMHSITLDNTSWKLFDAAVIITDHHGVDYKMIKETFPLVVDTRNVVPLGKNVFSA